MAGSSLLQRLLLPRPRSSSRRETPWRALWPSAVRRSARWTSCWLLMVGDAGEAAPWLAMPDPNIGAGYRARCGRGAATKATTAAAAIHRLDTWRPPPVFYRAMAAARSCGRQLGGRRL